MDRNDAYFGQLVTEADVDTWFDQAEQADWDIVGDAGLLGVAAGLSVAEHNPTPDLTVDVASGTAYDPSGKRIRVPTLQVVDLSIDHLGASTAVSSGGNSKILSLFVFFDRALSDPRIDDNSNNVFYVRAESFDFYVVQGAEASTGTETPPALESDKILLADVTIDFAQTQIFDADIDMTSRRQWVFNLSAGSITVQQGTAEQSDQAILTELNNHVTGVSNLHPASAIDYAGGSNWHDGTTNPATDVESQLDKIITDLIAAAGSDRIGAAVYGGSRLSLTAGSIQDQLREIADTLTFTGTSSYSDTNPFDFTHASLTSFDFANGADWEVNIGTTGSILFDIPSSGESFQLRDGTNNILQVGQSSNVITATMGYLTGSVADAYTTTPHRIATSNASTNEARGLALSPGQSATASDGTFIRFDVPGSGQAGDLYGVLGINCNGNEGADQRRTYIPTLSYLLLGAGGSQNFAVSPGGTQELAAQLTSNGIMDVECIVLARGDNGAGTPTSLYGRFVRRATIERTSGTYALAGSVETVGTDQHNFSDLGTTLNVTIVSTTSGPRIQVTPPSEGSDDAVWWGLMIVTALGHTANPDA